MTDRSLRDRVAHAVRAHTPSKVDLSRWIVEDVMDEVYSDLDKHAARAAGLEKRLSAVRLLHRRYRFAGDDTTDFCEHCNRISGGWVPYPCDTIRAIGEAS